MIITHHICYIHVLYILVNIDQNEMKLVLGNIIYNRKNKSALRKLKIALKLVFILVKIDLYRFSTNRGISSITSYSFQPSQITEIMIKIHIFFLIDVLHTQGVVPPSLPSNEPKLVMFYIN